MSDSKSSSGGIGFLGLLTIAFIVLKLCKVIAWSWLWVLAPTWIPLALAILFFSTAALIEWQAQKRRQKLYDKSFKELTSKWEQRLEEMREKQKLKNEEKH
jgi:hypothetical protein